MEKENIQYLMLSTKKLIEDTRKGYSGGKRPPFSPKIWTNINTLSSRFSVRRLAEKLVISESTVQKAKIMAKKIPGKLSVPKNPSGKSEHQFLEIKSIGPSLGPSSKGKIVMEFKTQSGMIITLFE